MRIIFAGSPGIAVPCLEALCNIDDIEVAGVLTNPDTAKGRSGTLIPTEVGEAAQKLGIMPILKPFKLDSAAREQIAALNIDLLVSFAYARLFGPKFLALFPLGGINIHPSILPKYRGPSPIQAAILNRDSETGVSIQTLAHEMDCGDILAMEKFPLCGRETSQSLGESAGKIAAQMLPEVIKKIASGNIQKSPQDSSCASYCSLVSKEAGLIDWNQSSLEIDAKIRAFDPWPLCRTIHNGRELLLLKASAQEDSVPLQGIPGKVLGIDNKYGILIQTGDGVLAVTELQYQAKKALFWRDFLNGARDFSGSQLG